MLLIFYWANYFTLIWIDNIWSLNLHFTKTKLLIWHEKCAIFHNLEAFSCLQIAWNRRSTNVVSTELINILFDVRLYCIILNCCAKFEHSIYRLMQTNHIIIKKLKKKAHFFWGFIKILLLRCKNKRLPFEKRLLKLSFLIKKYRKVNINIYIGITWLFIFLPKI